MKRSGLIAAGTILALAAFAAGLLLSRPQPSQSTKGTSALPSPTVINRLLAASLSHPNGQQTTLAQWRGKPLIVNFWATWCPPCLTEMPVFSRLQKKYTEVQFVGIAIDTPQNVQSFVTANQSSYPLLVGSEDMLSMMGELGNTRGGLPFTLTIDPTGRARHVSLGGLSEAETERLITDLR